MFTLTEEEFDTNTYMGRVLTIMGSMRVDRCFETSAMVKQKQILIEEQN